MQNRARRRTTVRGLMLVVALVGLATAAGVGLIRRRAGFLALAQRHEQAAPEYRDEAMGWQTTVALVNLPHREDEPPVAPPPGLTPEDPTPRWLEWANGFARLSRHHATLGRKYRNAAAHPWLFVEADPQDPPIPAVPESDDHDMSTFPAFTP